MLPITFPLVTDWWQHKLLTIQILSILQIECAKTEDELTSLCDVPEYSTIIDPPGWPVGKMLNLKSKSDFLTYILVEELVGKRIQLLQNFREGLNYFGLIKMINENPALWETMFVAEKTSTVGCRYIHKPC